MRLHPASLFVALGLALPFTAGATEKPVDPYVQSDRNAGVTPIQGDAVYKAFHGKAGIDRIVHRLNGYHHTDPRISDLFHAADDQRLERTLSEMFCYVLGGPCHYTGRDMASAHKDMGVQIAHQILKRAESTCRLVSLAGVLHHVISDTALDVVVAAPDRTLIVLHPCTTCACRE